VILRENLSDERLKVWLLDERQRLEDQLKDFGTADPETVPPGEVGYGNHPADYGTEVFEQEKELSLRHYAESLIERINAALGRFEQGTYGLCTNCGRPIEPERLQALPYVELCIECATQMSTR